MLDSSPGSRRSHARLARRAPLAGPVSLAPDAELRRLDAHFRGALDSLHRAPPRGLGPAQRKARAGHIEELERYRGRGRFPQNRLGLGLVLPIFIDPLGTRCAMAHLIERAGGADLVHHVATTRNLARVRQLTDIPELLAWLEANGLTAAEAARIQPSYCEAPAQCVCKSAVNTILDGVINADDATTMAVNVVYGSQQGVMLGDTVVLTSPTGDLVKGDRVLASFHPSFNPEEVVTLWKVNADGTIDIANCTSYATIPGPLPAETAAMANIDGAEGGCYGVLGAEDPGWTTYAGPDCDPTTASTTSAGGTGGGTMTGGASAGGAGGGGTGGAGGDVAVTSGCACSVAPEGPSAELAIALALGACLVRAARRRRPM